eukprot:gb/GFBE01017247.1/.p1 GENE.gb/GFBE01017247.1/~~gb/GFBE01017247.1/.p1  ORF type:complete len:266 (+),score=32.18 gb/GFBE01017247.1/:1-798(+)
MQASMSCWLAPSMVSASAPLQRPGARMLGLGLPAPKRHAMRAPAPTLQLLCGTALGASSSAVKRMAKRVCRSARTRSAEASFESAGDAAQKIVTQAGGRLSTPWFDPLGLCKTPESYQNARDLEMIVGRVAMLASIGLPAAELYHEDIADAMGLPSLLTPSGQAPHALNGGSLHPVVDLVVFTSLAGILATFGETVAHRCQGDAEFNPLNPQQMKISPMLSPTLRCLLREAQRMNGRVAMVAMTAMVAVETFTGQPVVDVTPFIF